MDDVDATVEVDERDGTLDINRVAAHGLVQQTLQIVRDSAQY